MRLIYQYNWCGYQALTTIKGICAVKKVKVVHLINSLDIGGAEIMLSKLIANTNFEVFEVIVITLLETKNRRILSLIEDHNVKIHSVNFSKKIQNTILGLLRLRKLVNDFQPDIIQSWLYYSNLAAICIRPLISSKPKIIWNIRSSLNGYSGDSIKKKSSIIFGKLLSPLTDTILINSQKGMVQHIEFGFTQSKFKLIGNGFNPKDFYFSESIRSKIREELGIDNEIILGLIGRFHPHKDHELFFKSVARLENCRFILVGKDVKEAKCRSLMDKYGVSDRAILFNQYSPILDIYNAIDYLFLTSKTEGFPNVVGEALLCEKPVISVNVGDISSMIPEHYLAKTRNTNSIIEAFDNSLKRQERNITGRRHIIENFSITRIVNEYEDLYLSLVE